VSEKQAKAQRQAEREEKQRLGHVHCLVCGGEVRVAEGQEPVPLELNLPATAMQTGEPLGFKVTQRGYACEACKARAEGEAGPRDARKRIQVAPAGAVPGIRRG